MSNNFFNQVAQSVYERNKLVNQESSDKVIPATAQFASVTMYSFITGDVTTNRVEYGPITQRQVGGLTDPIDGYLYHDGVTLSFATPDKIHFSAALKDITVESHEMGLMITFSNGVKILTGKSIMLKDPRFRGPFTKLSVGEEGVWKKEFARLGKLDENDLKKQQNSAKRTLIIFGAITLIAIIAAAAL